MIQITAGLGAARLVSGLGGRVRVNGKYAPPAVLSQLQQALTPRAMDAVMRTEATRTLGDLVRATPRRWTGDTRRAWKIVNPGPAQYTVENPSRVMSYLEYGTANQGTGYIYPVRAKALFIPLTRRAAMMDRSSGGRGIRRGGQFNERIGSGKKTRFRVRIVEKGGYAVYQRTKTGIFKQSLLVYGVDYVLAKRVRGIKPRGIAARQRVVTKARLLAAMKNHIRQAVRRGRAGNG